jgi:hypothetical protein
VIAAGLVLAGAADRPDVAQAEVLPLTSSLASTTVLVQSMAPLAHTRNAQL